MALIKLENFDGVTAPAVPSGWTFDASLVTTASFLGGVTPTSSPNTAAVIANAALTNFFGTFGTIDSVAGFVSVQANFNCSAAFASTPAVFGLTARSSVNAVVQASSTFYWLKLTVAAAGQFQLLSVTAGTPTTLATVNSASLAAATWYQVLFTLNGTMLQASCQRLTDSLWLRADGSFGTQTAAINLTDSSISGAGYAGFSLEAKTISSYCDDWSFNSLSAPAVPPNHPVVGRVPYGFYPANQY